MKQTQHVGATHRWSVLQVRYMIVHAEPVTLRLQLNIACLQLNAMLLTHQTYELSTAMDLRSPGRVPSASMFKAVSLVLSTSRP